MISDGSDYEVSKIVPSEISNIWISEYVSMWDNLNDWNETLYGEQFLKSSYVHELIVNGN